jgi:transmembrane sensor
MTTESEIRKIAAKFHTWVESGSEDPDMQRKFEEWLAEDLRHRTVYLRIDRTWKLLDRIVKPDSLKSDHGPPTRVTGAPVFALVAAALVILFGLLVSMKVLDRSPWVEHQTELGKLQTLHLRDGSGVILSTDSQIRALINDHRRVVELTRGEALFEVAHDPRHPFEVRVNGTRIQAVGTAFSVRLRDSQHVEILMREGTVALARSSAVVLLRNLLPDDILRMFQVPVQQIATGQMASLSDGHAAIRNLDPTEVFHKLEWTRGRLNFDGQTLLDAVEEMNRFNHTRVQIDDPSISNLRIGGDFAATDPRTFADTLARVFEVSVVYLNDGPNGANTIHLRRRKTHH